MSTIENLQHRVELIQSEIEEINLKLQNCEEYEVISLENELSIAEANLEALEDELTYLTKHQNLG